MLQEGMVWKSKLGEQSQQELLRTERLERARLSDFTWWGGDGECGQVPGHSELSVSVGRPRSSLFRRHHLNAVVPKGTEGPTGETPLCQ